MLIEAGLAVPYDGSNLNHELVREGWYWWHRKYAPSDTVLDGLEKESTREQVRAVG